jgi:hypothetical protein
MLCTNGITFYDVLRLERCGSADQGIIRCTRNTMETRTRAFERRTWAGWSQTAQAPRTALSGPARGQCNVLTSVARRLTHVS